MSGKKIRTQFSQLKNNYLTLKVSFPHCISALQCVKTNTNVKSLISNWSAIWNWIDLYALIWWENVTFKVDYSLVEKIEFLFFARHRKKHKMLFVRKDQGSTTSIRSVVYWMNPNSFLFYLLCHLTIARLTVFLNYQNYLHKLIWALSISHTGSLKLSNNLDQ